MTSGQEERHRADAELLIDVPNVSYRNLILFVN